MVLLLVFMQLTRDLFAIAKFLYYWEYSHWRRQYLIVGGGATPSVTPTCPNFLTEFALISRSNLGEVGGATAPFAPPVATLMNEYSTQEMSFFVKEKRKTLFRC